jgi:hypothetical protein
MKDAAKFEVNADADMMVMSAAELICAVAANACFS